MNKKRPFFGDNSTGLAFAPTGLRNIKDAGISDTAEFDEDRSKHLEGFHDFGKTARFWVEKSSNEDNSETSPCFDLSEDMLSFSGWEENSTELAIRLIKQG